MAGDEELSVLLDVDLTVTTKHSRGVSREKRDLQKEPCIQSAALIDRINVTVFGVGIDDTVCVNCYTVDAPLEAERLVVSWGLHPRLYACAASQAKSRSDFYLN